MTLATVDQLDRIAVPSATTEIPPALERITPLREALHLEPTTKSGIIVQAERLVESHADSPIALVRLAQALQVSGDTDGANRISRLVIEAVFTEDVGPSAQAAAHAAALLLAANCQDDAAQALVISPGPGSSLALAGIAAKEGNVAAALEHLEGSTSPMADAFRGWISLQTSAAHAVPFLRAATRSGNRTPDVLINLGYGLAALGSLPKAIKVTREATLLAPYSKIAGRNLSVYLHRAGRNRDALAELTRIASLLPQDVELAMMQAWAHVRLADDPRTALHHIKEIRSKLWSLATSTQQTVIEGSQYFLQYRVGSRTEGQTRDSLWRLLAADDHPSIEVGRMLASFFQEPEDISDLQRFISTTSGYLSEAEEYLLRARLACMEGDIDRGLTLVEFAIECEPSNGEAAGLASFLIGELTGDYDRAARVAQSAYNIDPSTGLLNNLAFALAMSGRGRDAETAILRGGGAEILPFGAATAALVQLSLGNVEAAREGYQDAVAKTRANGNDELADLIDWRRRIAMVQFGLPLKTGEDLNEPDGERQACLRHVLRIVKARAQAGPTVGSRGRTCAF